MVGKSEEDAAGADDGGPTRSHYYLIMAPLSLRLGWQIFCDTSRSY